jgi:ABC-type transport system involved in Fe-S cluster assembly fused permease/ATPase subunit
VIAHRLSTVRDADKIIVLSEAGIEEQGRHEKLIQKSDSLYKNLYQREFRKTSKN